MSVPDKPVVEVSETMGTEDLSAFIRSWLSKLRIYHWDKGDHVMMVCPFHEDNSPSCKVNTVVRHTDGGHAYIPGDFKCWGCGKNGNWNMLATQIKAPTLNLQEIREYSKVTTVRRVYDDRVDRYSTVNDYLNAYAINGYQKWPADMSSYDMFKNWRGVDGRVLVSIDAHLMFEQKEIRVFLPVSVNGAIAGGVKAAMEDDSIGKKYLTTSGDWAADRGLFLYDYAAEMNRKYIVIVEGPRDALRLVSLGIPAVAILGVGTITAKKIKLLGNILPTIEAFFTLADNDTAGEVLIQKCAALREYAPVFNIRLPKPDSKEALQYEKGKIDPFNMKEDLTNRILGMIQRKMQSMGYDL